MRAVCGMKENIMSGIREGRHDKLGEGCFLLYSKAFHKEEKIRCQSCGHHNRCSAGSGWICETCGGELKPISSCGSLIKQKGYEENPHNLDILEPAMGFEPAAC